MSQDKNIVSFKPKAVVSTSVDQLAVSLGFSQRSDFDMVVTKQVLTDDTVEFTFSVPTNDVQDKFILTYTKDDALWVSVSRCGQYGIVLSDKSFTMYDIHRDSAIITRPLTFKERDVIFASLTRDIEDPVGATTIITSEGRMRITYPKPMSFDNRFEYKQYREFLYVSFAWTVKSNESVVEFPVLPSVGSVTIEGPDLNSAISQLHAQLAFIPSD